MYLVILSTHFEILLFFIFWKFIHLFFLYIYFTVSVASFENHNEWQEIN